MWIKNQPSAEWKELGMPPHPSNPSNPSNSSNSSNPSNPLPSA
jgi:hypothetical protein